MTQLKNMIELVRDAVDKGATSVEQIQKTIMNQPLEVLEKFEATRQSAEAVERVQTKTIGSVYDTIRAVNQEVASLAEGLLASKDGEPKDPAK